MKTYTQGFAFDGTVILEDGKKLTIEEILERLNNSQYFKDFYCKDKSYHMIDKCTKQCSDCIDFELKFKQ